MTSLAPVLTPRGILTLRPTDEAGAELAHAARLEERFGRGTGHGLQPVLHGQQSEPREQVVY